MMVQTLWNTAKVVLRGKYIPIQAYLKKQEKSQNQPKLTLKARKGTTNEASLKPAEGKIIKIRAEINDKETNKKL